MQQNVFRKSPQQLPRRRYFWRTLERVTYAIAVFTKWPTARCVHRNIRQQIPQLNVFGRSSTAAEYTRLCVHQKHHITSQHSPQSPQQSHSPSFQSRSSGS
ncbi:hypothetical protein DIPPA_01532 [Diplonema papillatum]|nr:hypothetical protein DIPPA_01532 [Diplonema papillatum]